MNKKIKIVIPTIIICLCIAAIVTIYFVVSDKPDGAYYSTYYKSMGIDNSLVITDDKILITVDNGKLSNSMEGSIKFDGDIAYVRFNEEELICSYNKKTKTIVIDNVKFRRKE